MDPLTSATRRGNLQRIRVKGTAAFRSTPAEYMRDMLRYDDGKIEAIWEYPTGKRFESIPFTAIVQLGGYTPQRWRSFGLVTDVLGDVGEYSCPGYTVDEWGARGGEDCDCLGFGHGGLEIDTSKDPRDQDGGCPWCGRDCPDAGKPQGCWYQGCPDFPHGE